MNIEVLKDRIKKGEDKLIKKYATLERKKELLRNEKEDYKIKWIEIDIRKLEKEIEDTKRLIEGRKSKLKEEEEKEGKILDIKVFDEFLENWKCKAKEFYLREIEKLEEYDKETEKKRKTINDYKEEREYSHDRYIKKQNLFSNLILSHPREKEIDRMLDGEVKNKKLDLITRSEKVVGKILDGNKLTIGDNGSINGVIIGDKGRAEIKTIYAGGYNIQCLHYRVIIKKL